LVVGKKLTMLALNRSLLKYSSVGWYTSEDCARRPAERGQRSCKRSRTNIAHVRQSRPDSSVGFQVKVWRDRETEKQRKRQRGRKDTSGAGGAE